MRPLSACALLCPSQFEWADGQPGTQQVQASGGAEADENASPNTTVSSHKRKEMAQ